MERHGGVVQPRSGAGPFRKEDGRTSINGPWPILVQFKRTENRRTITVKTDDLLSVEQNAIAESRHPIYQFELAGRTYMVLTEEDFYDLRSGYAYKGIRG
jgi:hypothetical protein